MIAKQSLSRKNFSNEEWRKKNSHETKNYKKKKKRLFKNQKNLQEMPSELEKNGVILIFMLLKEWIKLDGIVIYRLIDIVFILFTMIFKNFEDIKYLFALQTTTIFE